ncbi:MAG: ribonuclease P protein component [Actinomycetota bacterium]|nr:ribonuclease P protein component [Actinomycetota bacterium]
MLERGRRASRDGLVAVALVNSLPGEPSRLGLAVRCKRGAVARNRVKRKLRAAFRLVRPVDGYDVVVRADDRVLETEHSRLVDDLGAALDRVTGGRT